MKNRRNPSFLPIENMINRQAIPQTPLEELVKKSYERLQELEYATQTLCRYRCVWNQLIKYAMEENQAEFNQAFGLQFLKDSYSIEIWPTDPITSTRRDLIRAIQILSDMQLHDWVRKRKQAKQWVYPKQFHALFSEVETEAKKKGYSVRGQRGIKTHCHQFAGYLNDKDVRQFSGVSEYHVQKFILTLAPYAKATIQNVLFTLKFIFSYAHENGYHPENLSKLCPKVKRLKKANIPSAFTRDEVNSLLASVDRGNPLGKRDYAVLMLAAHMGLRAGEIRILRFENFKWETERLDFIQPKTQKQMSLPLLPDIGWAIIDYIRYGRPQASQSKEVFVRHLAPYDAYGNDNNFNHVIGKYVREAKIKVPLGKHHGLHSLRHSLASALLENNTPLPTISEIIGHVNTETTNIYLKIDIAHLKECALEVDYAR